MEISQPWVLTKICLLSQTMNFNRIIQDNKGQVDELTGNTIDKFISIQSLNNKTGQLTPVLFLLKTSESSKWNRFFLDAGICIWDVFPAMPEDDLEDHEDYPFYDLGIRHGLKGRKISQVNICPFRDGVKVEIKVPGGDILEISTSTPGGDTSLKKLVTFKSDGMAG